MKGSENLYNCQSLMSSTSIGGRDSIWKCLGVLLKIESALPKKKNEWRCFKTAKKSQGVTVSHSELNYSNEGEADFLTREWYLHLGIGPLGEVIKSKWNNY